MVLYICLHVYIYTHIEKYIHQAYTHAIYVSLYTEGLFYHLGSKRRKIINARGFAVKWLV